MTDEAHTEQQAEQRAEIRAEAKLVGRWFILFPTFAVLVILAANFTLGFFKWYLPLEGAVFYLLMPVAAIVVLSNSLSSVIACMIAPRVRPAATLLGLGHFVTMIWGYTQFQWAYMPTIVWSIHALMVYAGLFGVYVLDRIYAAEVAAGRAEPR